MHSPRRESPRIAGSGGLARGASAQPEPLTASRVPAAGPMAYDWAVVALVDRVRGGVAAR
jgi:hypothetical protein